MLGELRVKLLSTRKEYNPRASIFVYTEPIAELESADIPLKKELLCHGLT